MNEKTKQVMSDIRKYKGDRYVILHAVEEMSELIKELLKNVNRGKDNIDDMTEELADVIICLEHVKSIYGISDDKINEIANEKIPRKWIPRIEKERQKAGEIE